MNSDILHMQRALKLAEKGKGRVHPNPLVGCVIAHGDEIVGEGYHIAFGRAHAEVEALQKAGVKARGATAYVTLEPCAHWGKTPPCTEALIQAGIKRVVAAMKDPNPRVAGRGFSALKKAGIEVTSGVMERYAQEMNRAFVVWVTEQRPYVTLKVASSLDGKTATRTGQSQWITSPQSRSAGHQWRTEADAIAVGIHTILNDNPSLTAHGKGRNPVRIIFDSHLKTPTAARCLREPGQTWILTTAQGTSSKAKALKRRGAVIHTVPAHQKQIDLSKALPLLAREGVAHLLVEGGATLHASFVEAKLVDEVVWYLAPLLIGGTLAKPAIGGRGVSTLTQASRLKDLLMYRLGDDLCIRGKLH